MVTAGIDFFHTSIKWAVTYFDKRIKRHCDNEQIAQGDFGTGLMLCVKKRFVCFYSSR